MTKIQTVPFHRTPIEAIGLATLAAHGARGRFSFYRLILSQFLAKVVGTKYAPNTGLHLTSFSALLAPVWRVDLAVKGTIRMSSKRRTGYEESIFHGQFLHVDSILTRVLCGISAHKTLPNGASVLAINNQVPGHAQAPLDRLAITSRTLEKGSKDNGWDTEPVTFSAEEHAGPTVTVQDPVSREVVEGTWPTPLTVIPFTHHPLNMVAKLAALPSIIESRHGVSVDPSKLKPLLFTAYPLYLPIYQAEYAVTSDHRGSDRITTVVFGGAKSMRGSHATYRSWLPDRSWIPVHKGLSPTTSYAPMPPSKDVDNKVSASVRKRFHDWLASFERHALSDPVPFDLVDPIYNWSEQVDKNPRARGEWAEPAEVLEYVEARRDLDVKETSIQKVEKVWVMGCAEHLKDTEAGKGKLKADAGIRKELVNMREGLDEQKRRVRILKLDWLEDVEQDLQRRASVGRGR
ncbi:BQ2448_2514 [Microbotryum intermedium]|uniref:BQ2448_2514 protein n=1 Tax=Microbotryum intermedium TaxID=269621 RepID=A0A238FC92_9BASI|nr:BQ2448_2514 [Microbotryum intermedium]